MKDLGLSLQATDTPMSASCVELLLSGSGRTVVLVGGELDLDSAQSLYEGLRQAVDQSRTGLTVDLRGVDFCDCSGLNVLLRIRHRAVAQGKTMRIRGASRQVEKLLAMTGARPLFTTVGSSALASPAGGRRLWNT
ncbi:STAS domain-containing protein [Streptomyces violascens]|uniref:STAS domain-containing protein n=1 Tax=Streptomyces violascens TaxID=67381 RepID=UPI003660754B